MFDIVPKFSPLEQTQPLDDVGHVVLLDHTGRPSGIADKSLVHHRNTPLHLAFSCYVVDGRGRVLLTRRSPSKRTWPGVWTNACCGHPRAGETLREAVTRHLDAELGLSPRRMSLAIGDYAYRAEMLDGTVEHELCPVVVVEVDGDPCPDPDETSDFAWLGWPALVERAELEPGSLSPWSVDQIGRLSATASHPGRLLDLGDPVDAMLDRVHGDRRRPAPTATGALERTRTMVEDHLSSFVADRLLDVPEGADALAVLHGAIDRLTAAGGKRLRPAFVLWGHVAAGGRLGERIALDAAAAVELLHTFALLHDDVMDRSDTRRGLPTAQHALRAPVAAGAAPPDPVWLGVSAAVLAGDLAFVWADRMFDSSEWPSPFDSRLRRSRNVFTTLRDEVIAGQYLDLAVGCSASATEADAIRIALLKSARYTVTRPLQIGAALGDRDGEPDDRLLRYGDATGLAFQLRDDVLGVFGDPVDTGKSAADDLREGKRTLLVLRALALTTGAGRATLERALGRADLDECAVERCREVIAGSGALASIEAAIDLHLERALAAAGGFADEPAAALTDLAMQAARRVR